MISNLVLVILLAALGLLVPTAYAAIIGAPFVPTMRPAISKALAELNVGPGDVVVDLGAGSGTVLLQAIRRGATAIGYELSPIMWAIAWLRLNTGTIRKLGSLIYWRNFFTQSLPPETTVIFVFLMPKTMPNLRRYLQKQDLPRVKYLLCYTFSLPDTPVLRIIQTERHGKIYVYAWPAIVAAG